MPTPDVPARWRLPDQPQLEHLRKQAKELRRRAAAAHPDAVELFAQYDPTTEARETRPTLARAQRVVARAYGFAGWTQLREHLAALDTWTRPMDPAAATDDPVDAFLRAACLSYTAPAATAEAQRMLAEDPALASASLATLAVCGETALLRRRLDEDPAAVSALTGPHRWPPLLYLAYGRLGVGDPVGVARVLLDAGADPNAGFLWQRLPSPFTAVTGVLGGGERDEPPHPEAAALATLLLDAGADPNDNQAFYNRQFRPDDTHLEPLLGHGAGTPRPSPWRDRLGSAYPSPAEMVGEHLRTAAARGFTARVRALLAHGVDPDTRGYHPSLGDASPYELAFRHGHAEAAALLAEAGASPGRVGVTDRLLTDILSGTSDPSPTNEEIAGLVAARPDALRVAAEQHGAAAVGRLLTLGFPVDAADADGRTALHEAALAGDTDLVRLLLGHGADRRRRDLDFAGTPADWAEHAGHTDLAEQLQATMDDY